MSKKKQKVKVEEVVEQIDKNKIQVIQGNTSLLTVQLLATINSNLVNLISLLKHAMIQQGIKLPE